MVQQKDILFFESLCGSSHAEAPLSTVTREPLSAKVKLCDTKKQFINMLQSEQFYKFKYVRVFWIHGGSLHQMTIPIKKQSKPSKNISKNIKKLYFW